MSAARELAATIIRIGPSVSEVLAQIDMERRGAGFYDFVCALGYVELGSVETFIEGLLSRYSEDEDPRLRDVAQEALDQIEFRRS